MAGRLTRTPAFVRLQYLVAKGAVMRKGYVAVLILQKLLMV